MRALPLAAAFLVLAASARAQDLKAPKGPKPKFDRAKNETVVGVAGKPIDLGGLLGGPQVAGPSASAEPDPSQDVLLAAVEEIALKNRAVSAKYFVPMFGPLPDGTAFTEQHIVAAGQTLTRMIKSGKIKVGRAKGAAGAWAPDIDGGKMTGGSFEVGDASEIKKIGRGARNYSQLFKQDQFANTILHEATHMFYSAFVSGMGFTDQTKPQVPEDFGSLFFWDGRPVSSLCTGPSDKPCSEGLIYDKPPCKKSELNCYHWKIASHGYGASGTEYAARMISQELCNADRCAAYGRVLAPLLQ